MSFAEFFAIAIIVTTIVVAVAVVLAIRESQARRQQRHAPIIFTPARALMDEDGLRGSGQNAELVHALSRLS